MNQKKNTQTYGSLCREWGKRQTWTLKQFLCLVAVADPDDPQKERRHKEFSLSAIDPREYKVRHQILQSFVGTRSLPPLNQSPSGEEEIFDKSNLIAIARSQGWPIPAGLEAAAKSIAIEEWVNAGKGLLTLRKRRRERLQQFVDEIYIRGENLDYGWAHASGPLPITKKHLYDAFKKREPDLMHIAFGTFQGDLKAIHAYFTQGRKPSSRTILKKIFSKE